MKKNNNDLFVMLVISLALISLSFISYGQFGRMMFFASLIASAITAIGIIIIGNQPPCIGVVTRWGKRLWKMDKNSGDFITVYVEEGWNFLFLRRLMYNIILIPLIKKEHDFQEINVITPDNATTGVNIGLAYMVDKQFSVNYLNLGPTQEQRDLMVVDWLDNILNSELRQWGISPELTSPQTWEKLIASKDETTNLLIKKIVGDSVSDEQIKKVKNGKGSVIVEDKGIRIIRLNLTSMRPYGPVYEASVAKNTEEKERVSEVYEVQTDLMKAEELKKTLASSGHTISLEKAFDKIMELKLRKHGQDKMSINEIAKAIMGGIKK